jgi:anti-sigma factor RsiW
MKCDKIQPMLSAFIDNALSARETWEVDRHLAECHECQRNLNEMKRTVQLLHDVPAFEVSADFDAKLQAKLSKLQPKPDRFLWIREFSRMFRPRLLPAWGAASILGIVLVLMTFFNQKPIRTTNRNSFPAMEANFVQQAKVQNMAFTAVNPLEDVSIANLSAHPSGQFGSNANTSE